MAGAGDAGTDADTDSDSDSDSDSDADASDDAGAGCASDATPGKNLVVTAHGAVQGRVQAGVAAFLGIPYAAPPVGELRWRAPADPGCYDGVVDAAKLGPMCPQLDEDTGKYVGDESCLTLNVWTPAALPPAEDPLPVLFFIHGGGNVGGGSAKKSALGTAIYSGESLAKATGAVVVTINYRIGPLGWLVHADLDAKSPDGASGNLGTRDIVFALEWVKDNIAAFGGDPGRVLAFGESAGAVNVCTLLVSPLAAGLFSAALMQSGGCVAKTREQAVEDAVLLLSGTQCAGTADEVACLRAKTPKELLDAYPPEVNVGGLTATPYGPYVDGIVIPDKPLDVIAAGHHNRVPFAVGANADETSAYTPTGMTEAAYESLVTASLGPLADDVLAEYPVAEYGSAWSACYHAITDVKFVCPARTIARAAAAAQDEPVFRYFFLEGYTFGGIETLGAFHGAEIPFVFGHVGAWGLATPPAVIALSKAMMTYWAGLASHGAPGGNDLAVWEEYDSAADDTLNLEGGAIRMEDGVRTDACDFWDDLLSWP